MKSTLETKIAEGRGGHIGRNILVSYAGQAISVLTPLILIPLYTRLLGHEVYGQWLMIQSVTVYLGLGSVGTWQSVGNRITESVATGRRDDLGEIVSTAFFGYAIIAVILAGTSSVASPWIFYGISKQGDAHIAIAFTALSVLLLLAWPFRTNAMLLRGFERVDQEQAVFAGSAILRLVGMAAVLYCGFKLVAVALVQGGTILGYGIVAFFLSIRLTREARPHLANFSVRVVRSLTKPSLSFFVMDASYMLDFSVDNLVIGYVMGTTMVTAYSVPYRMLLTLAAMFTVLLSALRPTLTTQFVRGESDLLYSGLVLLFRLAFVYATLTAFSAWLLGPTVLRVWAGAGVFPGRTAFGIQIAVFMMGVLMDAPLAILMATTRHYGYSKFALVEGLLNLLLSLWWIRYWGLVGVIGGTFTARLLTTVWYAPWAAFSLLRASLGDVLRDMGPAVSICVGAMAAAEYLDRIAQGNVAFRIVASAIGSGLIAALFAFVVFNAAERRAAWYWLIAQRKSALSTPDDAGSASVNP